jgi:hypothetical protein
MPPEYLSLAHLVEHKEMPDENSDSDESRQPLSCRITVWHHIAIEFLANRWNMSKSAVAAQVLEASLNSLLDSEAPENDHFVGDLRADFERFLGTKAIGLVDS